MKRGVCILLIFAGSVMSLGAAGFTERDVTVANDAAGIALAGTLTEPCDGELRGAVVLATGSGAQDRDETIFGHKPFKVIAEHLSSAGYAVLRMDDRGVGESGGDFKTAVTDDFVSDIRSGLRYLDSCYVDLPTGVIGHSEGGTIAIKCAVADKNCDFIVTLAAPAWAGDSIIMSQSRALAVALTGKWDAETRQRRLLDIAKSYQPDFQARIALFAAMSEMTGEAAQLPAVKTQISQQIDALLSPWYRAMLRYDPADDISRVTVPWLALNGTLDCQVLPGNLDTIAMLNPAAETMLLPGLNHLFQTCTTGLPMEYQSLTEPISPALLSALTRWLTSLPTK